MKISIITPVYKAEKFLKRCVESIVAQTYTNWELILVDDGSPDDSGLVCDEFALRDGRIKVIHKTNEGVSAARQDGLNAATGDFVIHADSDDWLAPNMLEEFVKYQQQTDADIVISDFYRVENGVNVYMKQEPSALDHLTVLREVSTVLYCACWNKLIRKSIIVEYNANFPRGINFGEDKCFLASLLVNDITTAYLNKPLYYYDASINPNSLVRNISLASLEQGFAMQKCFEERTKGLCMDVVVELKRRLKVRAMESGLFTNEQLKSLYSEINHLIKWQSGIHFGSTQKNNELFLIINGYHYLAKVYSKVVNLILGILKPIKKLINKK